MHAFRNEARLDPDLTDRRWRIHRGTPDGTRSARTRCCLPFPERGTAACCLTRPAAGLQNLPQIGRASAYYEEVNSLRIALRNGNIDTISH